MRRTQIYIDERQGDLLTRAAGAEGLTMSALIRRAIDHYLDASESEGARLERFRAAVSGAAGAAPGLPSGEDYVDALRPDYTDRARELWGGER